MTEKHGRGRLTGARVAALATALDLHPGLKLEPSAWVRAYPGGPADGFDAGADADVERPLADLSEFDELASAELRLSQDSASLALVLLGIRGTGWEASLETLSGDPGDLSWFETLLEEWPQ